MKEIFQYFPCLFRNKSVALQANRHDAQTEILYGPYQALVPRSLKDDGK